MTRAARAWAARLLIAATIFAGSASVMGYVSSGHTWGSNVVLYYINPNSTQLTPAAVIAAVQEAATAWTVQTLANVQLTYAGTTSGTSLTLNYKNEVFFRNSSTGYAGETYWWYDYTNRLVDADIVFYEGSTRLYTAAGCTDGIYLEDLAIHEFGHALGLEHSPVQGATMYSTMPGYCDRTQLTLHSDDIAGLEVLYPSGSTSQVPATPSSLSVTNNGTTSLVLHWSDRSHNESGFYVERSTDGGSFSYVASASANATSYNDGLLSPGTTYYYRVTAFNGAGQSSYSNVAGGQTSAAQAQSVPTAPANLQFSTTSTSVTLTWADTSSNESGFHIYVSEWGAAYRGLTSTGAGRTSFTWTDLRPGTSYAFRITAFNGSGESGYSNIAGGQVGSGAAAPPATPTSGEPAVPANLQFFSTSTSVTLTWTDTASNESGFNIYVSEWGSSYRGLTSTGAGRTSFTWSDLRPGTSYAFRITAFNGSGESGYSNIASGQVGSGAAAPSAPPSGTLAAPANLQFFSTPTSVTLTWTDTSSNESGFNIYVSEWGSSYRGLTSTGAGRTSFTWSDLRPGTSYAFRITAFNGSGESGYSNIASGQVGSGASAAVEAAPGVPSAPANLQFWSNSTSVTLTWTDASTNESGFNIYVSEWGLPFRGLTSTGAGRTSITWDDLRPGTSYTFRITAYNGSGESGYSNVASGYVGSASASSLPAAALPGVPSAPANLQFSNTRTSVTLTWTDTSNNESGFNIYVSEWGAPFRGLTSTGAGRTTFTWNDLRPGTAYAFRVTAYNAVGESSYSDVNGQLTAAAPLPAETHLLTTLDMPSTGTNNLTLTAGPTYGSKAVRNVGYVGSLSAGVDIDSRPSSRCGGGRLAHECAVSFVLRAHHPITLRREA